MRTPWLRDPNRRAPRPAPAPLSDHAADRGCGSFFSPLGRPGRRRCRCRPAAPCRCRRAHADQSRQGLLAAWCRTRTPRFCLTAMPNWSRAAGADGAHLTGMHAFIEAIDQLKPDRIAGAGGLVTRHDAMLAAEQGADYVMFGEPDAEGERPAFAAIEERVAWWAEVFEIPASAMPHHLTKLRLWSQPAPISSRSAIFFGETRTRSRQR